jgi:protein-S-isoprenylcysteine O-methyltransferase Ste14
LATPAAQLLMAALGFAIASCWVVFLALWALFALRTKPTEVDEALGIESAYALIILAGTWLLLKGTSDPGPLGETVLPHTFPAFAAGLAVTLAGLALAVWARVTLGRNWSSKVVLKRGHELIRGGPYARVRHPIYSGVLIMYCGTGFAVGTLGAMVGLALLVLGFAIKLRREEALMSRHFGSEYLSYESQAGALLPRLRSSDEAARVGGLPSLRAGRDGRHEPGGRPS